MNDIFNGPQAQSLIERVKAILLKPVETWQTIASEPATPGDLITRYAMPLAAIAPISSFIHGQLFGYGAFGFSYKPGFMSGLSTMVVSYIVSLIGLIVGALIVDFLAPKFDGVANRTNAFKLVIYASTASWAAGIFQLIPGLGLLAILGIYSLYLFYTGVTPIMKVPQEKALPYTAVTIIAGILLALVVAPVTAAITGVLGFGAMSGMSSSSDDGEVKFNLPGGGSIDTSKIEEATKKMEAAANGQTKPADPAALQGLLPASLGGYQRTAVENGAMGQMGAQAEGTYKMGNKTIRLKIVDSAGLGAIAGLGAAIGAQESKEDANGYEKTGSVNGQMQHEKWNKNDNYGEFGTQIGGRFMVSAEGEAGSIDELKAAVAAIDAGKLAALAQ